MAVGAALGLLVLTVVNYYVLTQPPAPGVDTTAINAVYVPFVSVLFAGLIRAVMIKVRIDQHGILVRNFWKTRRFTWDEFESFQSPGSRSAGSGTRIAAALRTKSGGEYELTAIQARNIFVISGRKDKSVENLVARMSSSAKAAMPNHAADRPDGSAPQASSAQSQN